MPFFKKCQWLLLLCILVLAACKRAALPKETEVPVSTYELPELPKPILHKIIEPVKMKDYFEYMETILGIYDTIPGVKINEYHLAHHNQWLINRLCNTDYYRLKDKGIVNKKHSELSILRPSDRFRIPNAAEMAQIDDDLANTLLDINLPEFKLRIIQHGEVLHEFPVRIGQTRRKYLAMAGHEVNLRTRTGIGEIMRINKNPAFINPANNHVYSKTTRDDGIRTDLPQIPWLEPSIDGIRYGQLIHPTTNPRTLGKASSNGCIGTREADAWLIYYHAPLGTQVIIRNDRHIIDSQGDTILLPKVYSYWKEGKSLPGSPIEKLQAYLPECLNCME